jgi:glycosyltransferase involved in cell wall biosynthesis
VLALYASCDILLSMHRSEGLGLHLMEAMALGRVVVATAWSGVMDFMTEDNSIEIGYGLVPVSSTPPVEGAYSEAFVGRDLDWAEPHVSEAVEALQRLAADPSLRARIGGRARSDMAARSVVAAQGSAFAAVREMWDCESAAPAFSERQAAVQLASHWRRSAKLMAKNLIKRVIGRA